MPSTVKDEIMSLEDAWSSRGRKTLRGIIETNGIECEIAGRSSNTKAVCMNLSRLNHSCNANCDYSWNERDQQMEIYAQTAISEGEELCISYIDVREPRQVRQQMLQDNWQFRCSCSKCSMRLHSASDKRRLRMGELSALLYSSRSSARKLRIAKKLLKLYKEEDFAMSLVLPSSGRVTGDFASCTGYRILLSPDTSCKEKLQAGGLPVWLRFCPGAGRYRHRTAICSAGAQMLSDLSQGCVSNIFVCATKMFVVEAVVAAVMACLPLCPQVMAATTIPPRSMSCSFKHHGHAVHQPR